MPRKRVFDVPLRVAVAAMVVVFAFLLFPAHVTTTESAQRREDTNNLRMLAGLLVARSADGRLQMDRGALDVYALVRSGDLKGEGLKILRSARSGVVPTDAEIERGDYRNFPWERYRGDGKLEGPPFPLLWEKTPDDEGKVLVAFSDSNVRLVERTELEAMLQGNR